MSDQQRKLVAVADYLEDLVATVTPEDLKPPRDRLLEDVQTCGHLDRGVIPLGLILAAAATIDKRELPTFTTRLANLLDQDVAAALDQLTETLLMVTSEELRASAVVAASLLVQRALPAGVPGGERVLARLLEIVDHEYKKRVIEHPEVFGPLSRLEGDPRMSDIRGLLVEVSDQLEDLACEKGIFLDDPVELEPKNREDEPEAVEDDFKRARLERAVDVGSLSEELEEIGKLAEKLGWTRVRALRFFSDLYRRKAMDARSKVGLSVATIAFVVDDLTEKLELKISDIGLDEDARADYPYRFDYEGEKIVLHLNYRGGISSNAMRDSHDEILAAAKQEQVDRTATALEKAVERCRTARAPIASDLPGEEEEKAEVERVAELFGLSLLDAYDHVSALYGNRAFKFSREPEKGVSLAGMLEFLGSMVEPGEVQRIALDPEFRGLSPFRVDREEKVFYLHPGVSEITDASIRQHVERYSIEPQPLVAPDETWKERYTDPERAGSIADMKNVEQLIAEFALSDEHALVSMEVFLEGSPVQRDTLSMQAIRTLLATLNERRGEGNKLDVVTGLSREEPDSGKTDTESVAWIEVHEEPDLKLQMLAINFEYGMDSKKKLPPLNDALLLEWCRHYKGEPEA